MTSTSQLRGIYAIRCQQQQILETMAIYEWQEHYSICSIFLIMIARQFIDTFMFVFILSRVLPKIIIVKDDATVFAIKQAAFV